MAFSMVVVKGRKTDIQTDSQLEVWMVVISVAVKAKYLALSWVVTAVVLKELRTAAVTADMLVVSMAAAMALK